MLDIPKCAATPPWHRTHVDNTKNSLNNLLKVTMLLFDGKFYENLC